MSTGTAVARPEIIASAQSALATAFSEGTVVLAFIALALVALCFCYKLVACIRDRRKLHAMADFKQAEMRRLHELAESTREEEAARNATFRNPVYDNLHVPGTVAVSDVLRAGRSKEHRRSAPEPVAYVPAQRPTAAFLRAQSRLFVDTPARAASVNGPAVVSLK